jgi:hypothetical protein
VTSKAMIATMSENTMWNFSLSDAMLMDMGCVTDYAERSSRDESTVNLAEIRRRSARRLPIRQRHPHILPIVHVASVFELAYLDDHLRFVWLGRPATEIF